MCELVKLLFIISVVCSKFYAINRNFTRPPVPPVPTNMMSEIPFPTVTICSPGLYRDNVQTSLEKSFNQWRLGKDKSWDRLGIPMLMAEFLEEKFQIREREVNLIDILNMMITPGEVDTILAANGVRENEQACALKASREKRSGSFDWKLFNC